MEEVVIRIPLAGNQDEFEVTAKMVSEWKELFPGMDIMRELRHIRAWNLACAARRKTKKGVRKHIMFWLIQADKGGYGASGKSTAQILKERGIDPE